MLTRHSRIRNAIRFAGLTLAALLLASLSLVGGQSGDTKKLTKEQLEKLFKDVKLPEGDPNPDFVERAWLPPSTDPNVRNKRGTDYGPCLSFTIQLGKNEFVRRGLTVQLPGDQTICYDLDLFGVAATWRGGFVDLSKTHFDELKGNQCGRPGGPPTLWVHNVPGWADAKGSFADPRKAGTGSLPAAQVTYQGHFLHGYHTILSYQVNGRAVLEMPGAEAGMAGVISRTFHVAAGEQELRLALIRLKGGQDEWVGGGAPISVVTGKTALAAGLASGIPVPWTVGKEVVYMIVPPSKEPLNLKVLTFAGPKEELAAFRRLVLKAAPAMDLRNWVRGGSARWKQTLTTQGTLGDGAAPYAVDTLTLPADNPWKSWLRPSAHDFFADGRLAVAMMNGDVWIVSGIDAGLKNLKWKRFATGLYEPLGLKILDDKLYVLGRDRITRLHDLNLDGEADYYESFYAGGSVSPSYHAFAFELQTDKAGNFYFVKSGRKAEDTPDHNALIQVSPDGKRAAIYATGFRHPNGMGIGPQDEIVVSDNQGEYCPSSKVSLIRRGGFYGYAKNATTYDYPLFWLPMKQDNSSGGQVWAGDKWGPLSGQLLHTSYGTCKLFYVLTQFDKGQPVHAAAVPFDFTFPSGIMRGRVNPVDGQVYVSGLKGWQTAAKVDGCVNRVRHTGKPAALVTGMKLVPEGIRLEFSCHLDFATATNPANYRLEQWAYLFSGKYGSPELSVLKPGTKGHDPLPVKSVIIDKERRAVVLEVPGLQPVDQLQIDVSISANDGRAIRQSLYCTIHRVAGGKK